MLIPVLETARLLLRPFTQADVDPLHAILSDREVIRYLPDTTPPSRERVVDFVDRQIAHWHDRGFGWWGVEYQGRPQLLGWAGLAYLPATGEVEVAYLLTKAAWGQGIATEAARACVAYGFERIGLRQIIALVHPENAASRRVILKLGMAFVDEAHYFGIDVHRYALEREVWEATH
jgi:ribosomal-protein-alanine N-acetyltransferase